MVGSSDDGVRPLPVVGSSDDGVRTLTGGGVVR